MADIVDNAAGGEELSKNAAKKLAKLAEAEKKKAEKAAEKAAKAAEQPEKKDKIGAEEVEELDPTKYYENRLAAINTMEVIHRTLASLDSPATTSDPSTPHHLHIVFTGSRKDCVSAQVSCVDTVV